MCKKKNKNKKTFQIIYLYFFIYMITLFLLFFRWRCTALNLTTMRCPQTACFSSFYDFIYIYKSGSLYVNEPVTYKPGVSETKVHTWDDSLPSSVRRSGTVRPLLQQHFFFTIEKSAASSKMGCVAGMGFFEFSTPIITHRPNVVCSWEWKHNHKS